jgi:hypothetical protein
MADMEEPFRRGELVTLREFDTAAEPLGRLRRVHESEMDPEEPETPGGSHA